MSAASPLSHRLPGHAISIPRVLIRNQALLVPAELRLATLLFDRMDREERFVPIPDQEWTQFTGLDPRSKEMAIRGLKDKALLKVEGTGAKARYCSDTRGFMRWAADVDRSKKPRTAGRGVTMKPGLKVHPECQSGCAMLRADQLAAEGARETGFVTSNPAGLHLIQTTGTLTPSVPIKESGFAKPVSRVADPEPTQETRRPRHLKRHAKDITPDQTSAPGRVGPVNAGASGSRPAVQNSVQPVAQDRASSFARALARLALCGPHVGIEFLRRLLAAVDARHTGVSDEELTEAISRAAAAKGRYQKSVGLFLETVPDVIGVMRAESAKSPPGVRSGPDRFVPQREDLSPEDQDELDRMMRETPK